MDTPSIAAIGSALGTPSRDSTLSARQRLQERLATLHREVRGGRGASLLLQGPAGIGKSHVLRRFAEALPKTDRPLFGHGDQSAGAPALWPFIALARALQSSARAAAIPRELEQAWAPWLAAPLCDNPPSAARQFLLGDEIIRMFIEAATLRPLCLIFEDLHEYDAASLDLLRRLLARVHEAPLLLLASSRALHDLALPDALHAFQEVTLVPALSRAEVEAWLTRALIERPSSELVCALHARSEGNPLYVASVVAQLHRDPAQSLPTSTLCMPASLRLAATAQLDALGTPCRSWLQLAAVLGREFEASVLERMHEGGSARQCLRAASLQGVIVPCLTSDLYRFSHELLRELLISEQRPTQLCQAHLLAARALERQENANLCLLRRHRIATHYLETDLPAGWRNALEQLRSLAAVATTRGAHQEAAHALELAERAQRRLADATRGSAARSARVALGQLQLERARAVWSGGQHESARQIADEVTDLAHELGCVELQLEAALAAIGTDVPLSPDPRVIALCERALAIAGDARTPSAITLRARFGTMLCFSAQRAKGEQMIERACALYAVEPVNAEQLTATLLLARYYAQPDTAPATERRQIIEAYDAASVRDADRRSVLWARLWQIRWHMEHTDDLRVTLVDCRTLQQAADAFADPLQRWYSRMLHAACYMRSGALQLAQSWAEEARRLGREARSPNAEVAWLAQHIMIERLRGHTDQVMSILQLTAAQLPHLSDFSAALCRTEAELGHWQQASTSFCRASAQMLTRDDAHTTVFGLCELAHASLLLSRAPCAAGVYGASERALGKRLLVRIRVLVERWVVVGQGQACLDPVEHACGALCLALGQPIAAQAHVQRALERCEAAGAWGCVPAVRETLALCLYTQGDVGGAREQAARALRQADPLGLSAHATRLRAFLANAQAPVVAAASASAAARPCGPNEFLSQGDVWKLTFEGVSCLLSDAKGMRYLQRLLAAPGTQIHAAALAFEGVAAPFPAWTEPTLSVRARSQEADRALDHLAARKYIQRARELREAVSEADSMNDLSRKERYQTELTFLERELQNGLRARHAPDERARKAVYNCIRHAIHQIGSAHERLGRHLSQSIRTGVHCCYAPELDHGWVISP
jgi:hypothetical protein